MNNEPDNQFCHYLLSSIQTVTERRNALGSVSNDLDSKLQKRKITLR